MSERGAHRREREIASAGGPPLTQERQDLRALQARFEKLSHRNAKDASVLSMAPGSSYVSTSSAYGSSRHVGIGYQSSTRTHNYDSTSSRYDPHYPPPSSRRYMAPPPSSQRPERQGVPPPQSNMSVAPPPGSRYGSGSSYVVYSSSTKSGVPPSTTGRRAPSTSTATTSTRTLQRTNSRVTFMEAPKEGDEPRRHHERRESSSHRTKPAPEHHDHHEPRHRGHNTAHHVRRSLTKRPDVKNIPAPPLSGIDPGAYDPTRSSLSEQPEVDEPEDEPAPAPKAKPAPEPIAAPAPAPVAEAPKREPAPVPAQEAPAKAAPAPPKAAPAASDDAYPHSGSFSYPVRPTPQSAPAVKATTPAATPARPPATTRPTVTRPKEDVPLPNSQTPIDLAAKSLRRQTRSRNAPPSLDAQRVASIGASQGVQKFTYNEDDFRDFNWTDGEFGFSFQRVFAWDAATGDYKRDNGRKLTFVKMAWNTGRGTSKCFKVISVGDILIQVGDTRVCDLPVDSPEKLAKFFTEQSKNLPVKLTFQKPQKEDAAPTPAPAPAAQ